MAPSPGAGLQDAHRTVNPAVDQISVRVCDGSRVPVREWTVLLPAGATLQQALLATGEWPAHALPALTGVFGVQRTADAVLTDGDRVEVYPPLICDPKERRRRRATASTGRRPTASR